MMFQVDLLFQILAREVKSYIKDYFLKKLGSLPNLRDDIILCTVDVFGLCPNIPHDEGFSALRKQEKDVTTSTLVELAEVVLKNNVSTLKKKNFKAKAWYNYW